MQGVAGNEKVGLHGEIEGPDGGGNDHAYGKPWLQNNYVDSETIVKDFRTKTISLQTYDVV